MTVPLAFDDLNAFLLLANLPWTYDVTRAYTVQRIRQSEPHELHVHVPWAIHVPRTIFFIEGRREAQHSTVPSATEG